MNNREQATLPYVDPTIADICTRYVDSMVEMRSYIIFEIWDAEQSNMFTQHEGAKAGGACISF